jgi:hypothetical protein
MPGGRAILIPALFISFFGHVTSIVAYTVTGTSGLPNEEQGLATGLTSMTQQVGIMIGIPILSAIAATQSVELTGIHLALSVNVGRDVSVGLVWIGLHPRGENSPAAPVPKKTGGTGPRLRSDSPTEEMLMGAAVLGCGPSVGAGEHHRRWHASDLP